MPLRRLLPAVLTAALGLLLVVPASAAHPGARARPFPDTVSLPEGFQPEGVAIARGIRFFVGSIPTGAIYSGDIVRGEGEILVPAQEGRAAIGLATDRGGRRLFVAGGPTGQAYVYNARTGADIATYQLTDGATFINDVVLTRDAAYFTDSVNPVIYRVPLLPGGRPAGPEAVETIPLSGDIEYQAGFNANGIEATPDGDTLVIVQSNTGKLFTVDPDTGVTDEIHLGNGTVVNGDGILLDGKRTLYVVQNQNNVIVQVRLSPSLADGEIVDRISDEDFDVPTTIAEFGDALYAVNARFGITNPAEAAYQLVALPKP